MTTLLPSAQPSGRLLGLAMLFTLAIAPFAQSQERKQPYLLTAPTGWPSEQIKLPPGFAPELKLTGHEDIRFAPGMFTEKSDSFFSYAVLFWIEPGGDLSAKALQRELRVYYQGLSATVLESRKPDAKPLPVELSMKPVEKTAKRQTHAPTRYAGELTWTEPFKTGEKQELRFEVDVWKCEASKRDCVFLIVSPQPEKASIWKDLRKIRKEFRCHRKEDSKDTESPSE